MPSSLKPLVTLVALLLPAAVAHGQSIIDEISPKSVTLAPDEQTPQQSATGGRVNGLGRSPTPGTYYAASEWGGIFKTEDGGIRWRRLTGHLPQATWDVEVDPNDSQRVYATSFYDGKRGSPSGINVSDAGGETWRSASAIPPDGFCRLGPKGGRDYRKAEPSAFGIAIDPTNSAIVYIGTNCGLARSTDRGVTWTFIDPSQPDGVPKPGEGAVTVWDIVIAHGNVDVCGESGHRRLASGSTLWTTANPGGQLVAGRCSIAASPDESNVLFAAVGLTVYGTVDGKNWRPLFPVNPPPPPGSNKPKKEQGRIPFVATNKRLVASTVAQKIYDLYYGDELLWRSRCSTPAFLSDQSARCLDSREPMQTGAHSDVGDIAFARGSLLEDCPALFSNDGGVFRNAGPQCQNPKWAQAEQTTNALWAWGLAGLDASSTGAKRLYFGSQDNGLFVTASARKAPPDWRAADNLDVWDVAVDPSRLVYLSYWHRDEPHAKIFLANLAGGNRRELKTYPGGDLVISSDGSVIASLGGNSYAVATKGGVFVTDNIEPTSSQVEWRKVGKAWWPLSVQEIQIGKKDNTPPTLYVLGNAQAGRFYTSTTFYYPGAGKVAEANYAGIFKHVGTGEQDRWEEVKPDEDFMGFGIFAVDPKNPDRIIASQIRTYHLGTDCPPKAAIFRSYDGGKQWQPMPELDRMMVADAAAGAGNVACDAPNNNARFNSANENGPTRNSWFLGYPQPTLLKFDPADSKIIVAGGADSGVFISYDDGVRWTPLTAGVSPTASRPHIPRPRFAHFDHVAGTRDIYLYIGSQGRGLWRIKVERP